MEQERNNNNNNNNKNIFGATEVEDELARILEYSNTRILEYFLCFLNENALMKRFGSEENIG